MTLHQMMLLYLAAEAVRGASRRTIERRRWSLRLFVEACEGIEPEHVRPEDVERFLSRYRTSQTVQSIRSDVNQLFRFAQQRGHVERNPCDLIRAPRIGQRVATPVPVPDVHRAIQAARPEVRLMVMLMAYAGLRVSEVAALRAEHVDVEARVLTVHDGKGAKSDTVPLADELMAELERWPARGRLFPGMKGNAVSGRIRRLFRALGIDHRPHDLRHSFGTQAALRTGGNLPLVSQLMRHTSVSNTQRYVRYHAAGAEIVSGLYGTPAA